jgi:hypothetical protein
MNSQINVFANVGRKLDDKVIEKPKITGNKYNDEISLAIYNSLLQNHETLSKEELRKKRIIFFSC